MTQEFKVLSLLAKRKYPDAISWLSFYDKNGQQYPFYKDIKEWMSYPDRRCLICEKLISFSDAEEHGIQHLKEYKLLAFL